MSDVIQLHKITSGSPTKFPLNQAINLDMFYDVDADTCSFFILDISVTTSRIGLDIPYEVNQNITVDQMDQFFIHKTSGHENMKYIQLILSSSTIACPYGLEI